MPIGCSRFGWCTRKPDFNSDLRRKSQGSISTGSSIMSFEPVVSFTPGDASSENRTIRSGADTRPGASFLPTLAEILQEVLIAVLARQAFADALAVEPQADGRNTAHESPSAPA